MRWFGEPWPSAEHRAPVCEDDADRTDPPPEGERCLPCGEGFAPDAQGVLIPHIMEEPLSVYRLTARPAYYHLDCFLRMVLGNVVPEERA